MQDGGNLLSFLYIDPFAQYGKESQVFNRLQKENKTATMADSDLNEDEFLQALNRRHGEATDDTGKI